MEDTVDEPKISPSVEDDPKDLHDSPAQSLNSEEADKIRSQVLATEKTLLPSGYFWSPKMIGSFAGTGIIVCATYFQFQATAAVLGTAISQDIRPSLNTALVPTVWTISQPISLLLFGRLSDRFGRRGFALRRVLLPSSEASLLLLPSQSRRSSELRYSWASPLVCQHHTLYLRVNL